MPSPRFTIIGRPSMTANEVQRILRVQGRDDAIGPLRMADSRQNLQLESVARQIADGTISTRQLLLTTGLGLSPIPGIPVRLPSLLVPGLHMMKAFQRRGRPVPPYLIYQATDFIAETNGIPVAQARRTGTMMEQYLRAFIHALHPSLEHQVHFHFGNDQINGTPVAIERITQEIRDCMESEVHVQDIVAFLESGERKHASRKDQLFPYAAANVIHSGAVAEHYPYQPILDRHDTRVILPIGGMAEKPFFRLTNFFARRHAPESTIIPLLTTVGSRPVYYPYREFDDPCSPGELGKVPDDANLRGDLQVLKDDGATPGILRAIFPSNV